MSRCATFVHGGVDQPPAICSSVEKQEQGHPSSLDRCLLWLEPYPVRLSTPFRYLADSFVAALGHLSRWHTAGAMASSAATASENRLSSGISPCVRFPSPHISLFFSSNKKYDTFRLYTFPTYLSNACADCWRRYHSPQLCSQS
jgi:hypothetical protein